MISAFQTRRTRPSFGALILITGTTALSTDTYIAALPELQASLGTSASVAQLTMTSCIAGMALGQLVMGPISDARGRRALIVWSTVVFTLMSAVCALSDNGWVLVAARAAQGIACGAAAAVGRAVVSDIYRGRGLAAKFGTLSAVGLIAPVLGPAIGGVLLAFGSWQSVFWFLGVVGVAMTLAAVYGISETLPRAARQPGGLDQLVRRSRSLLAERTFALPVVVQCLTVGGFFVYIGGSSFVLQTDLGITQGEYTVVFAVNAIAMMVSSLCFRLLVLRLGPARLRRWAMRVQTAAVLALAGAAVLHPTHQPPLVLTAGCLLGMTFGLGSYLPANSAIVQGVGRRYGGTASALGGGIPFLVGALTTPLTGLLGAQTVLVMSLTMATFFVLASLVAVLGRQGRLRTEIDEPPAFGSDQVRSPIDTAVGTISE